MNHILLLALSYEKGDDIALEAGIEILGSAQTVNNGAIARTFYARTCLPGDLQA